MKKTVSLLFLLITIGLVLPKKSLCQTYTSILQLDLTRTGEKKLGYEPTTLTFSKDKGIFTVKFSQIKNTQTFNVKYLETRDQGDYTQTMYTIENDPNYGGLKINEYKKQVKEGKYVYTVTFTIYGMGTDGSIGYYTIFYANKKIK